MNATSSSPQWLFVAAAKGLQGYVLRSDPLKEMIGASELIESLPRTKGDGFLAKTLAQLDPQGKHEVLTDASGAARILFTEKQPAEQLARLWPVLAAQFAPGLEISVALVQVENGQLGAAIEQAEHDINVNRNLPAPSLPEAGPWVTRNRRTGLPAAQLVRALEQEDRKTGKQDAVDDESARKREAAESTAGRTLLRKVVPPKFDYLVPTDQEPRLERWPLDLTKLATADNSYLAIIHADANGLGAAMMACLDRLKNQTSGQQAETYRKVCQAIEDASQAAAQAAMQRVIAVTLDEEEVLRRGGGRPKVLPIPVRPIVCAGEDFTCVVRAAHAIQFVEDYLEALEQETADRFKPLSEHEDTGNPSPKLELLTACAGVVFCNSHFPFSRAYAIAEKLCGFAKNQTHRKASALAFLRLKSSLQPSDDYELVVQHAFQSANETDRVLLTMNPYAVGGQPANGLPTLQQLRELVKALDNEKLPHSGLRGLVSRAYEGQTAADQAFERLRLVLQERDERAWKALDAALNKLTGAGLWKTVAATDTKESQTLTPLYDALELLHLER
jgi:hypothetical protein